MGSDYPRLAWKGVTLADTLVRSLFRCEGCRVFPVVSEKVESMWPGVVHPRAARELAHRLYRVALADVDHVVGAETGTDLEPVVAGAGEDHRLRAERLRDGRLQTRTWAVY